MLSSSSSKPATWGRNSGNLGWRGLIILMKSYDSQVGVLGVQGVLAIMGYLEHHNKNPQPFQWTADADLILERVAKVCKRLNNSEH